MDKVLLPLCVIQLYLLPCFFAWSIAIGKNAHTLIYPDGFCMHLSISMLVNSYTCDACTRACMLYINTSLSFDKPFQITHVHLRASNYVDLALPQKEI